MTKDLRRTVNSHRNKRGYRQSNNFRASQPDLYLILGCKIYPLHKTHIISSGLIFSKLKSDERVVILDSDIEPDSFQSVLEFLYDRLREVNIQRLGNIFKMYETAKILQVAELQEIYQQDFYDNFEEYQFFQLYNFAINNQISQIIEKCQQELFFLDYEQINFSRLDLLSLPKPIFERVIRNHQKLKANKEIVGITAQEIRDAIALYADYNRCQIDVEQLMKVDFDCFEFQGSREVEKTRVQKSQSFLSRKFKQFQKSLDMFQSFHLQLKQSNELKMQGLKSLTDINEQLQQKNKFLLTQIETLKDQILEDDNKCESNLLQISKKLQTFQQICRSNTQKLKSIQKQMQGSSIGSLSSDQFRQSNSYPNININLNLNLNLNVNLNDNTNYQKILPQDEDTEKNISHSQQTTNPSESQTKSSICFDTIPRMERNFGF